MNIFEFLNFFSKTAFTNWNVNQKNSSKVHAPQILYSNAVPYFTYSTAENKTEYTVSSLCTYAQSTPEHVNISHLNDCARKHYVAGWCCEWALEVLLIAPKRLSSRLKVLTELNIFTAKCKPFFFIFHEYAMYWFAVSSEHILHISIDSIINITFIIMLKKYANTLCSIWIY